MTLSDPNLSSLIPPLRALATQAGEVILRHYQGTTAVTNKADGSPVTQADRDAEAVILPGLQALTPDIPIVSEEDVAAHGFPTLQDRYFWLVDPLDGTKEFIHRNGEFTVNIALIDGDAPVLGIVFTPVTGDLYVGAGPGTALHAVPGRPDRAIAVRPAPSDGITVAVSRSHGDSAETDLFLADYPVATRLPRGSSLKFCTLAAGEADLYPRFGPTCEWDTAAGHAVLAAAGGRVETTAGAPFRYRKPAFRNPSFVAFGGLARR